MPRIRALKHEFFMDEETAALPPDAQLLLLALSTLADRDGLLEDRPVRIKAQVFPYRDVDVDAHLRTLEYAGQVVRYVADGKRCLFLVNFARDQKPHPKETSLNLPHPPMKRREVSGLGSDASRRVPLVVGCGSGSGNGSSSLSAGADEPEELPDATEHAEPAEPAARTMANAISLFPEAESTKPKERPEDLQALWNAEAHPNLPRWKELTDKRRRQATTRLRERPLSEWREVIRRINGSAFLRGEEGKWRASPDWLLQPDAAVKVLEGKYDAAPNSAPVAPPKPTKFIEM